MAESSPEQEGDSVKILLESLVEDAMGSGPGIQHCLFEVYNVRDFAEQIVYSVF